MTFIGPRPWNDELAERGTESGMRQDDNGNTVYEPGLIRKFETGATRDVDTSKHDPEGFLSPLVIDRYNEFMHTNRRQRDGNLRDSDNWQKGIPLAAYMKSMWRHFLDVWLHHRGLGAKAKEPLEVALCALLFNVSGYLHETLKDEQK